MLKILAILTVLIPLAAVGFWPVRMRSNGRQKMGSQRPGSVLIWELGQYPTGRIRVHKSPARCYFILYDQPYRGRAERSALLDTAKRRKKPAARRAKSGQN